MFDLVANFKPAGDQPKAIKALISGFQKGCDRQTLLGVTGSGKTFTAAHVIQALQKPTLVIAPNKTLAAQLCNEFRELFPKSAVHYFVSYYDYYQPEAYLPTTDTYIGKEAMINNEIDKLRHAATASLLTRSDVIIVASVSCIYGLGAPEAYAATMLHFTVGDEIDRTALMRRLTEMQFTRTNADLSRGQFRLRGNEWQIMPADQEYIYHFDLEGGRVKHIFVVDPVKGFSHREEAQDVYVFPAKHFITPASERKRAVLAIREELRERLTYFKKTNKPLEAERIERRTRYDAAMISEVGYCHGIENYSRHLSGRPAGEAPDTLLSYFPFDAAQDKPDFLLIIDESHVTVPQLNGMYAGDQSRKKTLIEFGFRLPSAADNRPLQFKEFEARVSQTLYMSATPGSYELGKSKQVVQQIIRPTGLIDPEVIVRPITGDKSSPSTSSGNKILVPERSRRATLGQIDDLIIRIQERAAKKERVLVTTLTKKMAEDLTQYLQDSKLSVNPSTGSGNIVAERSRSITVNYIHSDVETLDRIKILTEFRKGAFDVLIGVNLLREGLDLPEVSLVAILDADKEGFLRSETSLIQTIGRAARNINGQVILYADVITGSLTRAIAETNRRRALQMAYNNKHGITPKTIERRIHDIIDGLGVRREREVERVLNLELSGVAASLKDNKGFEEIIRDKQREMREAAKNLDFELAAILRDEIKLLKIKAAQSSS